MVRSGRTVVLCAVFDVLMLWCTDTVLGQAYRIDRIKHRIVVNTADHWSNWTFPKDIVTISRGGRVEPRLIRRNINACLDAEEFGGGVSAGSNSGDAVNVIDDDPNTYWEPNLEDPLRNWWVEIDLGRCVQAKNLVIRFAEEGDPFLQFRVYLSFGREAYTGSKVREYVTVGQTTQPNKTQRVFEFVPKFIGPMNRPDEAFEGEIIRFIRIKATQSDFDRAEEMTKEEYERLDLQDRGAVVYHYRRHDGSEQEISEREYDQIPPENRGSVVYYRRERPRLAEIEVLAEGDNIGQGILERGGSIRATGVSIAMDAFDGDFISKWDAFVYSVYKERGLLTVDLGAAFWVDAVNVLTNSLPVRGWFNGTLLGYVTRVSDGSRAPDGSLLWDVISPKSRENNAERAVRFTDSFSLRKVRYLEFKNIDVTGAMAGQYGAFGYVNEMQIYGRGYVPEIELQSGLIDVGGERNLRFVEWGGDEPPGTRIEIQTRSGKDLMEVKHYHTKSGEEITEMEYTDLPPFQKGEITSEYVPGSGWSGWSPPYRGMEQAFASPSPRRYLMLRARLLSDDPDRFASLDFINIYFVAPVAREVVGEVYPFKEITPGKSQEFSLYLKVAFDKTSEGIDELLVQAVPAVEMSLTGLGLGTEGDFQELEEIRFVRDVSGEFVDPQGRRVEVLRNDSDSLWVRLPELLKTSHEEIIQISFRCPIYLNGTLFLGYVGNSRIRDSWQRADPGDATLLTPSVSSRGFISVSEEVLGATRISPNPFTPNGDGINDETTFEFAVFRVTTAKPVEIGIYTLGGEVVRRIQETRPRAAGLYRLTWDGTDDRGDHVPSGIYLCRIGLDVDSLSSERDWIVRPVYVAY